MTTLWPLLLVVLYLASTPALSQQNDASYTCPAHCSCLKSSNSFKVHCYAEDEETEVKVKISSDHYAVVECSNSTTQSQLAVVSQIRSDDNSVVSMEIQSCPLPASSYGELFANILAHHKPEHARKLQVRVHFLTADLNIQKHHLAGLSNITSLSLSFNGLTSVPEDLLYDLPELNQIELDENKLQNLPSGIFQHSPNLQSLHLDNNEFSELPENIFDNLSSAWLIFLQNNKLKSLGRNMFVGLTKLQVLDLSNNQLQSIHPITFKDLTSLKSLKIADNNIWSLSSRIFQDLTSLERLDLNNNAIMSPAMDLPDHIFDSLNKVVSMKLAGNQIQSLPWAPFMNATKNLELDRNNLSFLEPPVIASLLSNPSLISVTLSSNPWRCDCGATELLAFTRNRSQIIPDLSKISCVDGRSFSLVNIADLCSVNLEVE